jgi:type III restriction enzyme
MARLSLSEHTLDVNVRRCDVEQFDWSEVEDYVLTLTGERDYQYNAIRDILVYLWGGIYADVTELARENYARKSAIQQRFHSDAHFLHMLPLPDRVSGVCHLATGTGKSYVMFAVAHLSILLGKVQRVLVLGPSSTVIEEGLREKFKEYLYGAKGAELQEKLPDRLRHKVVRLLNCNDFVEDSSIVIENINAIYTRGRNSIGDWFDHSQGEVLVLSDEVHHAYSHLTFTGDAVGYDFDGENVGRQGDTRDERLWMKFIREEQSIRRHIGFTGTPYNADEYFPDVICNYSIRDAIDEKIIKKINPILRTEADEGDGELTRTQRFEQIIETHRDNSDRYAYRDPKGRRRVKPITIFIHPTQAAARNNADEFVKVLAETMRDEVEAGTPRSALEGLARDRVITVVSELGESEYKQKLAQIEETEPDRVGGKVEYIFAVNKLSEGWDVDNVFQIVPSEQKVFNSKLLISQVLGRGLRLPRQVPSMEFHNRYPMVTITNHERFATHIRELLDEVTECELRLASQVLVDPEQKRHKHHFNVFNLEYVPTQRTEPREPEADGDGTPSREIKLTPSADKLGLKVTYLQGTKRFDLSKDFFTVDQVVLDVERRFRNTTFESQRFDFGEGLQVDGIPSADEIAAVVRAAMATAGIEGDRLSRENRQQIELYFNQFLPKGKKKVIRENKQGRVLGVSTLDMQQSSARAGSLDHEAAAFVSEDYQSELTPENLFVINELTGGPAQMELGGGQLSSQEGFDTAYIRQIAQFRNLYAVNTSLFRTPQGLVIARYKPERQFIFRLVENSRLIASWVKSPDTGFYGLDYEYWKAGKDRVRRSFNPDFFIRVNLADYLLHLPEDPKNMGVQRLRELQDAGTEDLILVVEIKDDDDDSEQTRAKGDYGDQHFRALNVRLRDTNPVDFPEQFRNDVNQIYAFWILRPAEFNGWLGRLRTGLIAFDMLPPGKDDEPDGDTVGHSNGQKIPHERLYAFTEVVTRTDRYSLITLDAVSAAQLRAIQP